MRDLILSVVIGGIVVVGATDFVGLTDLFHGQNAATAIRDAVPVQDLPSLPALPSLPSIPEARAMLGGATSTPAATATAGPQVMYISHTNGAGVRPRVVCADEAAGQGAVAEGTTVTVVRPGASECPGWAMVTTGKIEFWVRMAYLDASAPKPPPANKPVGARPAGTPVAPPKPDDDGAPGQDRSEQDPKGADAPVSVPAPAPTEAPPTAVPTATSTPAPASTPAPEVRPRHTPVPTPTEEPKDDEN